MKLSIIHSLCQSIYILVKTSIDHQTINLSTFSICIGRFVTAMLYLTGDLAGGRTIFPLLDVGVSPEAGALLYWSTKAFLFMFMLNVSCNI